MCEKKERKRKERKRKKERKKEKEREGRRKRKRKKEGRKKKSVNFLASRSVFLLRFRVDSLALANKKTISSHFLW